MNCSCGQCTCEFYTPQPALTIKFTEAATTVTVTNNALDAIFELVMDDNATTGFDGSNWNQNIKYSGKGTTLNPQDTHEGTVVLTATLARAFFFASDANSGDPYLAAVLLEPGSGGDWTSLSIKDSDLSNKSAYFLWFESAASEVSIEEGQEYKIYNDTFSNYTAIVQGDIDDTGSTIFTTQDWDKISGPTGFNSPGQSDLGEEIQIYDTTTYVRCIVWDSSGSSDPVAGLLLDVSGVTPSQADQFGQTALTMTFSQSPNSTFELSSPAPPKPLSRPCNKLKWLIMLAAILLVILLFSTHRK